MNAKHIALAVALVTVTTALAAGSAFPGPAEFRSWAHVKSMVITDKSHGLSGFHNVYADSTALKALKGGVAYPEGAQFAVSFYEVTSDGAMLGQGKKQKDLFMRKDSAAKTTGGWAFGASGPDGKPLGLDVVKGCYECHAGGAKGTDLIFSKYQE